MIYFVFILFFHFVFLISLDLSKHSSGVTVCRFINSLD